MSCLDMFRSKLFFVSFHILENPVSESCPVGQYGEKSEESDTCKECPALEPGLYYSKAGGATEQSCPSGVPCTNAKAGFKYIGYGKNSNNCATTGNHLAFFKIIWVMLSITPYVLLTPYPAI